jgi:hypothetical protein
MLGLTQALLLSVYAGAAYAKTVSYDFDVGYVTVSTLIPSHDQRRWATDTFLSHRKTVLTRSRLRLTASRGRS